MKYIIAIVLSLTIATSFITYSIIRKYDNFVTQQQQIGFDKGYEQAIKDNKTK